MIDITNQEAERVGESIGHWIVDLVITLLEIIWDIITTYLAWTFYIAIVLFILGAVLKYFGFFTNQETGEDISYSKILEFSFIGGFALVVPVALIVNILF